MNLIQTDPLGKSIVQAIAQMNGQFGSLTQYASQLAAMIYANPAGTPQQVFDRLQALTGNAGQIVSIATAFAAFYQTCAGTSLASFVPAGASLVVTADGSVTFTPGN